MYAAYYGKWKSISEVYSDLYCSGSDEKKPNTGRISHATKALANAGYIVAKNDGPGWCKWTSTLLPLYVECHKKGIELSDGERGMLEQVLCCEGKTAQSQIPIGLAAKNFGLTAEEVKGLRDFEPTPVKIKQFLHAILELSIMYVGNRQTSMTRGASDGLLNAMKTTLSGTQKARVAQETQAMESASISSLAKRIAMLSRGQLAAREMPEKILFFKLLRLLHDEETAQEIEGQILSAYE